jgi:hypothetical protein
MKSVKENPKYSQELTMMEQRIWGITGGLKFARGEK